MSPTQSEKFLPDQRIRKKADFKAVFEKGRSIRGKILKVWVLPGPARAQLGLIVSRKVQARANARNLWKRRIREAFRRNQGKIKPAAIVVQALGAAKVPQYLEIEAELLALLKK